MRERNPPPNSDLPEPILLTSKLRERGTFQHDTFPPVQGRPTSLGLTSESGNVALLIEVISRNNLIYVKKIQYNMLNKQQISTGKCHLTRNLCPKSWQ